MPAAAVEHKPPFPGLMDVVCKVNIRLGTRTISVRDCLALRQHSIIRLVQPVGDDLHLCVEDVLVAKGEVVMVDDSTSIRLTDISPDPGRDSEAS
ncbi:MAG: FliM/FliN family flagellar motor switch protein [Acidobacteriota bacterium]